MKRPCRPLLLFALAVAAVAGARPGQTQAAPSYTLTDLGFLSAAHPGAVPRGINDAGQVTGTSPFVDAAGVSTRHVFRWDPVVPNGTTGTMQQLSLPSGYGWSNTNGWAAVGPLGINSSGQIAGGELMLATALPRAQQTAFFWNAGGGGLPLAPQGAAAYGLNNAGDIAGLTHGYTQKKTTYPQTATLWTLVNGQYVATTLPGPASHPNSPWAREINNSRQVVGTSLNAQNAIQGWIWLPAPAYGLPAGTSSLAALAGHTGNVANAVNDLGQVAGGTYAPDVAHSHGLLWLPSPAYGLPAGKNDLGTLYVSTTAAAINGAGQIVGTSNGPAGSRACLWQNGAWQDLNNLVSLPAGWVLTSANAINSQGQIAGAAVLNGNSGRGYLLTPQ